MKILAFDIETTPILGYVWGMWEQNVIEKKDDWHMLSFAYKWIEGGPDKKVHCLSLPYYKGYKKDKTDDTALVEDLWMLMNYADVIVAHNGDEFDIKKAHARFMHHGMIPPRKTKTIDTLKVLRKYARLDSNKLDYAADYLGVGRKIPTGGFSLWKGCMSGDKKSWELMKKYNKQDVELLVRVFEKLRPWIVNRMNTNPLCPKCTVGHLHSRGPTPKGKHKYECQDCGKWSVL